LNVGLASYQTRQPGRSVAIVIRVLLYLFTNHPVHFIESCDQLIAHRLTFHALSICTYRVRASCHSDHTIIVSSSENDMQNLREGILLKLF
jgi:hypothetical protein